MKISLAIEEYLAQFQLSGVKNTETSYKTRYAEFKGFILDNYGDIEVEELTAQIINAYQLFLKNKGQGANTINQKVINVKSFLNWLVNVDILEHRPFNFKQIIKIKVPKRVKVHYLTEEEYTKMISEVTYSDEYFTLRNRAILILIISTGLRREELLTLKFSNIKNNSLEFMGKGSKERVVPLSEFAQQILNEYIAVRNQKYGTESPYVFISRNGDMIAKDAYQYMIKKALKVIGRESERPHVLRKTFAYNYIRQGGNLFELKEILGHSDIKTTEIYVGISDEQKREGVNRINFNFGVDILRKK
ncbi:MAG: tyrosine-type recombinase/integrase [Clostridia bacterium]|nr:tyrosine-type recombinase/integrase [Clostridia bacterium]